MIFNQHPPYKKLTMLCERCHGELKKGEYNRFTKMNGRFQYHPHGGYVMHKSLSRCDAQQEKTRIPRRLSNDDQPA